MNITAGRKQKYGEIIKMKISGEGIALIKIFEGCKLESYRCAANVVTIGYGHIKTAKEGMVITQEEAEDLLMQDIKTYEKGVIDLVQVDLKQCEFDALVSFSFNLGLGSLKSSTLLKRINAKDWADVPHQIKRWNKANGEVLEGLVRRREAEATLWQGKDWTHI